MEGSGIRKPKSESEAGRHVISLWAAQPFSPPGASLGIANLSKMVLIRVQRFVFPKREPEFVHQNLNPTLQVPNHKHPTPFEPKPSTTELLNPKHETPKPKHKLREHDQSLAIGVVEASPRVQRPSWHEDEGAHGSLRGLGFRRLGFRVWE